MTDSFFLPTIQEIGNSFAERCREIQAATRRYLSSLQSNRSAGSDNPTVRQTAQRYAQYSAELVSIEQKAETTALRLSNLIQLADQPMSEDTVLSGETLFRQYEILYREIHDFLQETERCFSAKNETVSCSLLCRRTEIFLFRIRQMESRFLLAPSSVDNKPAG